ncbi:MULTISPECIES: MarR family winged helix-turn-helix transcriptional regulator [unclassified Sphingobium]|uniref:MarR family winged helix-turn-helix transcriptional regulator n=1 Tax=unclassified Sphingobium TaxID=2611147 RepID=UPI00222464B3|nr:MULTISPECIES: MarR family transcriptional regulator [unclassified Sphingobium]MCW2393964.1 MarR family transcriptional regulator for hemolysin [Sphingobium sp. B8D3B]MCW2417478.1 MarR family transcriptional regulator for hemolysin [Sphingobium sp. B8D3C]
MKSAPKTAGSEAEIFGKVLPPKSGYPSPDMALTITIVMLARRWRALVDEKLRDIGQSASRMEAMSSIAYAPPGTTQIQIAKRVGIEGPTLTRTLDLLEAEGLVERLPDPSDRRNKLMRLTAEGYQTLAHMLQIAASLRAHLLEDVSEEKVREGYDFFSMLLQRIESGLDLPADQIGKLPGFANDGLPPTTC